ncbi:MAG: hypothetical protein D6805_08085 [Planctomycetota bacterium]|nr:MAG: hypothetical protein D6805_08085 [Planctomycetota bacterium]
MKQKTSGFTILEILIAIVILVVGILGIMAIFPKAIDTASKSVEETYAGIIAQSVIDSVKLGIRETKVTKAGTDTAYFILQHEGVPDLDTLKNKDYTQENVVAGLKCTILMPVGTNKGFLYPKTLKTPLKASVQDDDRVKYNTYISDIYAFGTRPAGQGQTVGVSYLQNILQGQGSLNTGPQAQLEKLLVRKDPYLFYGFTLYIRRSTLNNPNQLSDNLYRIEVGIYRNWWNRQGHKNNKPKHSFIYQISF